MRGIKVQPIISAFSGKGELAMEKNRQDLSQAGRAMGPLIEIMRQVKTGEITPEQLQSLVEHRNPFEPMDYGKTLADLVRFYKEVFGIEADFTTALQIPEKHDGFNWLIIMFQGLTANKLYDKCKERFGAWRYTENLDTIKSVRTTEKTYAIWLRDRVEADEENKNKSANDCEKEHINGITLPERLLQELWYHWKTGKHLDIQNITLCSGSRYPHGFVPFVDWNDVKLLVYRCGPDSSGVFLRSRVAVST